MPRLTLTIDDARIIAEDHRNQDTKHLNKFIMDHDDVSHGLAQEVIALARACRNPIDKEELYALHRYIHERLD